MKVRKVMIKVIFFIVIILAISIILLALPQSPLKNKYNSEVNTEINKCDYNAEVFTNEDIKNLPLPVQRYFKYCGFMGKTKMVNCRINCDKVMFRRGVDKPPMKTAYEQHNFVKQPTRMAYMCAKMFGIPFEGRDKYQNGEGAMTGSLAKVFTLFNVTGKEMNQSALVTCLAESLLVPNMAIQSYITWEAIDNNHARGIINWNGIKATGIFSFSNDGEMISFQTNDRYMDGGDGKSEKVKWTCTVEDYIEVNGIKHPNVLKGIWNLPEGDFVYIDIKGVRMEYDVK